MGHEFVGRSPRSGRDVRRLTVGARGGRRAELLLRHLPALPRGQPEPVPGARRGRHRRGRRLRRARDGARALLLARARGPRRRRLLLAEPLAVVVRAVGRAAPVPGETAAVRRGGLARAARGAARCARAASGCSRWRARRVASPWPASWAPRRWRSRAPTTTRRGGGAALLRTRGRRPRHRDRRAPREAVEQAADLVPSRRAAWC